MNNREPFPDIRHLRGGHVVYFSDDGKEFDRITRILVTDLKGGNEYRIRDTAGLLVETTKTEPEAIIAAHMRLATRFRRFEEYRDRRHTKPYAAER